MNTQINGAGALQKVRVGIAGLGGLGSHIAVFLARSGVKHLHLVDFDRVDKSNLSRQHYFMRDIGRLKTQALAEQLLAINPALEIKAENVKLTETNTAAVFKDDFIICEAADRPETKAMLVNTLLSAYTDKYVIASSGLAGVGRSNDIKTRKIGKNFYLCGDGKSGIETCGRLAAPRAALCAAHAANLALALILGLEE